MSQIVEELRRSAVIAELERNRRRRDRIEPIYRDLRSELRRLLALGKDLGIPVATMCEAVGLARRSVYELIEKEKG